MLPPERRWPRRLLKGIAGLLVICAVAFAAVWGARQVWFLGTDTGAGGADHLALFRGLPYELPLGIELYSTEEISSVPLDALPVDRREVVVNHELRSEDDARSLLGDLERATVTVTVDDRGSNGKRGNGEGSGKRERGSGGSGGSGSGGSGGQGAGGGGNG